jgi:ABC-2 type transport system permease protein
LLSRADHPTCGPWRALRLVLRHEVATLLRARALWTMFLLLSPLTGYGYIEAVRLFADASLTAAAAPELAARMTPLDGIFVPTLGAHHLGTTLLFPFVAIAALARDRETGALSLTLQWPLSTRALVAIKFLACTLAWLLTAVISVSALGLWSMSGGHLAVAETGNLLLGHLLYAVGVIGVALLAAAVTRSSASAAIVALAFTLGFWVLDFAASSDAEGLGKLAALSPSMALRRFEQGLWSWPHALALLSIGLGAAAVAVQWVEPALTRWQRIRRTLVVVLGVALLVSPLEWARAGVDISDDRRNSFSIADEAALRRMDLGLTILVHLEREDSRARELAANVLAKLERLVPDLDVRWVATGAPGAFAAAGDDRYGLLEFQYRGLERQTRSNSSREILPLLHELSGARPSAAQQATYEGHPHDGDTRAPAVWFFGILPFFALVTAVGIERLGRAHRYRDLMTHHPGAGS